MPATSNSTPCRKAPHTPQSKVVYVKEMLLLQALLKKFNNSFGKWLKVCTFVM